ncbi:MAG: SDR family NAD(P)-dependent oxidoreductase [Actinomycetota bacterium]|nr:SDR family NAD(P)-dependent oxidoreductase [Actinomycetota bacterium]
MVTGGANGIGRACALRFAEEGADILVADLQDDAAAATAEEVGRLGRKAIAFRLDAADVDANEEMADAALKDLGRLDVVVTAAGISHGDYVSGDVAGEVERLTEQVALMDEPGRAFVETDPDSWRRTIDVNLTGTFLSVRACARRMLDRGTRGSIVTIASIAAKDPSAGPVAYTSSKAGVWMLTKKAALELGPAGIRVNAIGPGYIRTNMTKVIEMLPDDRRNELESRIPLGRLGEPGDIANMALFLASDESAYVTGEIFHPDGGWFTG